MIVRRAEAADGEAAARVVAAEDPLVAQPPIDLGERGQRLRELVDRQALWILEDRARLLGYTGGGGTRRRRPHDRNGDLAAARGRGDHYRRRDGSLRSTLIMAWHVDARREDPAVMGN